MACLCAAIEIHIKFLFKQFIAIFKQFKCSKSLLNKTNSLNSNFTIIGLTNLIYCHSQAVPPSLSVDIGI